MSVHFQSKNELFLRHLVSVVETTPDIVFYPPTLLRELEDPHSTVDLFLLSDSEPIRVNPRPVNPVEGTDDGREIFEGT